ncbi:DNA mismatch repair endonuclease MutL [Kangiella sp. HD9-110m-PIT-SAG07]|nr:DNA mismatch repair endonuclease MutL [Kangiella sp. HD9-110m-PIT-SAG07]
MSIKKLSPLLANQIAAGEVVERPSSVVKELLENAIDAGATRIQLDIERGGTRLIRITDDGHGIEREQLELALARHATSKIESTEDLKAIHTLGFRGEALASISSVARLTLSSKARSIESSQKVPSAKDQSTEEASPGWSAIAQGHDMAVEIQPRPMPVGTIVEVRDLFFNTPARQKFLRAERTEYVHIEETMKRVALASPHVALTLKHNGKVTKRIPAAKSAEQQKQRIGAIVSNSFLKQALHLDSSIDSLRIWGWLSSPEHHQNSNLSQYVFVNGRAVRDRTLNHAIRQAYQELLPTGRVPAYVLYLELDAESVDVNVHPTKHEVRFSDARQVHDFISRAVAERLQPQDEAVLADDLYHVEEVERAYVPQRSDNSFGDINSVEYNAYEKDEYYHPRLEAGVSVESGANATQNRPRASSVAGVRERHYSSYAPKSASKGSGKEGQYIVVAERYLLQPQEAGVLLLDVKSFWLDYTASLLQQEWDRGEVKQRPLLIPERLGIPVDSVADEYFDVWAELGFDLNVTGPKSVALRKVPSSLLHIDIKQLTQELLYATATRSKTVQLKDLQLILIDSLSHHWKPESQQSWLELLQPHRWQESQYCQELSESDIGSWLTDNASSFKDSSSMGANSALGSKRKSQHQAG